MNPNNSLYPLIPHSTPCPGWPFSDPRREIVECFSSLQFVRSPGLNPLSVQIRGLGPDSTSLPGMLGGPGYDMGTHDSHQGEIEIFCETSL